MNEVNNTGKGTLLCILVGSVLMILKLTAKALGWVVRKL